MTREAARYREALEECLDLARHVIGSIDAEALKDLEAGWGRLLAGEDDYATEVMP